MNFLCKCIKNFVYVSVACFVEKKGKGLIRNPKLQLIGHLLIL